MNATPPPLAGGRGAETNRRSTEQASSTPAPRSNQDRIVAEFPKNRREVCRVALTRHAGIDLISIRCWVVGGKLDGTDMPTRNGLTLRRTQLASLMEALEDAKRVADQEGGAR